MSRKLLVVGLLLLVPLWLLRRPPPKVAPSFPLLDVRRDGRLHDVRTFVRPGEASRLAEMLWTGKEETFIEAVLRWIHTNIVYRPQAGEYWRTPAEVLEEGVGDCEDLSILCESAVINYVPRERFWVSLGENTAGAGHAWNHWMRPDGWYVDCTSGMIGAASSFGYSLFSEFNDQEALRLT